MSFASEHSLLFSTTPLEALFPAGMFDEEQSKGSTNALSVLRIVETLIREETAYNALLSRYALLQEFPRVKPAERPPEGEINVRRGVESDFLQRLCRALTPFWYGSFLSGLGEDELEVFLKNYLLAHETWGHVAGVARLVRTMVEQCLHIPVLVRVEPLQGQTRTIPQELHSQLGSAEQYSSIGHDFVLGRSFASRPDQCRVTIGPISMTSLEKLQKGGWAAGTQAGRKLQDLVEFATPFYFRSHVTILLETVGCVLGQSLLGTGRLGTVVAGREEQMNVLVGGD